MGILRNWLFKRLGVHVCEEFTQWEKHLANCTRTHEIDPFTLSTVVLKKPIVFTRTWQERRCTMCGKIEQRELD